MPEGFHIIAGSTPVVAFGDFLNARVATLGLNPSRVEFQTSPGGGLLPEKDRRLATMDSLKLSSLPAATNEQVAEAVAQCCNYFQRNPYRKWFDQLDRLLQTATGTSYYEGTACHLDLVQWATDPVWGKIQSRDVRNALLAADRGFLRAQLEQEHIEVVLLNGRGVVEAVTKAFELPFELRPDVSVGGKSSSILRARAFGAVFLGWSKNFQSSYGMTNALREAIAVRIREEVETTKPRPRTGVVHARGVDR